MSEPENVCGKYQHIDLNPMPMVRVEMTEDEWRMLIFYLGVAAGLDHEASRGVLGLTTALLQRKVTFES